MPKNYDRAYFDKWYRSDAHRVGSRAQLARKVAMVVHLAEHYLARPIRSVLDVGCGEAPWRAALLRLRPGLDYRGLDSSEYVVRRYARSRNIGLATFGQLEQLRFDTRFDLIVCSDMLHYVPAAELRRGLAGFGELLEGLAFIEVFTSVDRVGGDLAGLTVGLIKVKSEPHSLPRRAGFQRHSNAATDRIRRNDKYACEPHGKSPALTN
ncbi:class I SAM-dependent methyltransferase [Dokdonella sp.]|uniref:methyltransferase n=1 Tax=Dokdonella sp. TaxID=2291710 RepID=UPI0027B93B28|nr:class I SAM-dependent methyltransferase [Dokdonella sp.]